MYCPHQISYVIRQGDDLYQLARHFQTTIQRILSQNPNLDPYNLQIGTSIVICPGETFFPEQNEPNPLSCPDYYNQLSLTNRMRVVWQQHVYWTRMLLISIAERLKDEEAVTTRLLQNPNDIANIFRNYYSMDVTNIIAQLLTEHLQIGAKLITALRDGKTAEAKELNRQWYVNANKMADAFSRINPYYNYNDLLEMLYRHLELTTQEVSMRLAGNYSLDINAFDSVEQEILSMADYFTSGLMNQFPQKFN